MAGDEDRTYVGYTGPRSLPPLRPMTRRSLGSSTILVLQALARGFRYGFDVMDATELPSGTVYPILSKLEAAGLARSAWEDARIARREKRPPLRGDHAIRSAWFGIVRIMSSPTSPPSKFNRAWSVSM